jgi:hypothetical protein
MKATLSAAGVLAACAWLSTAAHAQWPTYPTLPVPKIANGQPDMNAPPPRTPDGKPDLNGVWRGAPTGQRGAPPPAQPADAPPLATFRDVGSTMKGGLPLTPWGAEELKKRTARNSKDNPEAHCLPMGIVQFHTQGFPRKFVHTPKLLVILYEASSGIRQIFIDGRPLPKNNEPQPWFYGYSSGHWDGDTLVVETNNLRDDGWLDIIGSPLSDQAKLTERFRRVTYGRMEIDITVDDPKAYTRPWTVRHLQEVIPDGELIEFICEENQRFSGDVTK